MTQNREFMGYIRDEGVSPPKRFANSCTGCASLIERDNAVLCDSPNLKQRPDLVMFAVSLCGASRKWYSTTPHSNSTSGNSNAEPRPTETKP